MKALILLAVLLVATGAAASDEAEILAIHRAVIDAHLAGDAAAVLAAEAPDLVVVSRGEVLHPTRAERTALFESYLGAVEFSKDEDFVEPIVRVSADGTMAWLICEVDIAGTADEAFAQHWAWIEVYEKRDGKWLRVAEVSNMKSPPAAKE